MKFSLLLLSTLLSLSSSLTIATEMKIYRWVDKEGKVHFSDTAVPGTAEIEVKNNNLLSTGNKKRVITSQPTIADESHDKTPINYQANITSPEDDKALRSNNGSIDIHVSTTPAKKNTQTLQLYLDGKKLGSPQLSTIIQAQNINRGTHQVQVELLDKNGKTLAKTQIVTVHLQRITIK